MGSELRVIGKSLPKQEAILKATGALKYTNDIFLLGMLYARFLRSPYPHARVKKINTSEAEKVPGVKAVITFKDVPKVPMIRGYYASDVGDGYILEEKARHVGDRIAAVAATTLDAAQKAIELIDVKYEELLAVFDPVEAMKPDAPKIHETVVINGKRVQVKNNIVGTVAMAIGDVEKGFKEADLIVEEEYRLPRQLHYALEPRDTVCVPRPDRGLDVWATTQSIHNLRHSLSLSLGIPVHKIRVHQTMLGGSFGRGIRMNIDTPICALLALKTGRPVKWDPGREDVACWNHRNLSVIRLKMGVKKDGTITAQEMKVFDDAGAYAIPGTALCALMCGFFFDFYRCPNSKFEGFTIYTNTPPACAMRGAGNPNVHFAMEVHIDRVAEEMGIDPIELRLKNHIREGDVFYGQGPGVKSIIRSCGTEYLLKKGAELIGWDGRGKLPKGRGIGMARGFHTSGASSAEPAPYMRDYTGAIVKVNEDGSVNVMVAAVDFGQGNHQVFAQIVAEQLGVKYEDVIVTEVNTDIAPYNANTHASRSTYIVGGAVKAAAENAKKQILKWAGKMLKVPMEELEYGDGKVYVKGSPEQAVTVAEVAAFADSKTQQLGTIIGVYSGRREACPPSFTAYFVEVEVDMGTWEVKILKTVAGADVGTVINPAGGLCQIGGGLHLGMGYALTEEFLIDERTGKLLNPLLTDYKILRTVDMPDLEVFFAETYEPTGPFGAKGMGEASHNPVAPAIANAIYNATGVRIRELPITPEKILAELKRKSRSEGGK